MSLISSSLMSSSVVVLADSVGGVDLIDGADSVGGCFGMTSGCIHW